MKTQELTVSQVARLAHVSVRTLHHYDEIGLLQPSGRSHAGYRLYGEADLQRLQQILFFRALELPLPEITRIMTEPDFDVVATLKIQREMLVEKVAHSHALIAAVEAAINRIEKGTPMTTKDTEESFSPWKDFDASKYEAEAEQRWGGTAAFKESKRRTARYTKADWELIQADAANSYGALVRELKAGTPPDAEAAMDAAEVHRAHISRWFYDCSPEIHRGLGELYDTDARFTATVDKFAPGLSAYARQVFAANAARQLAAKGESEK
jgi:MerR family transcriptional regulator, thiopeptide resistance regulator